MAGAPSGTGCSGANGPGERLRSWFRACGEAARGDVIGEDRRLAGGAGQVPAVAEELGDPNARQRGARHRPERQLVGPCLHARRAQGGREQVGRGAEGEEGVIAEMVGVVDGRFGPGDEGDEREVPGHQMVDHGADVHPVARGRQLPLVCPDASHDALHARDRGVQIGQLISFVHGGNSIPAIAADSRIRGGTRETGNVGHGVGREATAGCDGRAPRGSLRQLGCGHAAAPAPPTVTLSYCGSDSQPAPAIVEVVCNTDDITARNLAWTCLGKADRNRPRAWRSSTCALTRIATPAPSAPSLSGWSPPGSPPAARTSGRT